MAHHPQGRAGGTTGLAGTARHHALPLAGTIAFPMGALDLLPPFARGATAGTCIGHVHLKVGNATRAGRSVMTRGHGVRCSQPP